MTINQYLIFLFTDIVSFIFYTLVSGLYLGKPSQSRHAYGVPLKSCAVRPSVSPGYVGVFHAAIRAVLRFFQAFYGVIAMLPVAVVSGM